MTPAQLERNRNAGKACATKFGSSYMSALARKGGGRPKSPVYQPQQIQNIEGGAPARTKAEKLLRLMMMTNLMEGGLMDITSYDPKKVTIVAGGRAVTGCATDGMVTATHNEDRATTAVGAQGDIAYSENANNSGTVTVSLMSTSSSLAYLRDLCARRVEFPLNIADANDADSIHISEERCRILKFPDLSRAKEQATVTIDIFVPDLNYR